MYAPALHWHGHEVSGKRVNAVPVPAVSGISLAGHASEDRMICGYKKVMNRPDEGPCYFFSLGEVRMHMIRRRFHFRETIATILAEREDHVQAAREGMMQSRHELENHISIDPFFRTTLEPYATVSSSLTVNRMSAAGLSAGVGPMAAVAGTIAWAGVESMVMNGATFAVIDNGGDIALVLDRMLRIGIHAGTSPWSDRLAFEIPPRDGVLGICTSSATVGPSLSLGSADAVTVFSPDPALADAWATAICNSITPSDTGIIGSVPWDKVEGVFVISGEWIGSYGTLPPLVKAKVNPELVTGGPW